MSTHLVSVVIDAVDPPALARWWSAALGWPISFEEDEEVVVEPLGSDLEDRVPALVFVPVPEAKAAKNRVHLDVRAAPGLQGEERMTALEAECDRLVGLGAARVRRYEPAPPMSAGFIVMTDPEGNVFCLD